MQHPRERKEYEEGGVEGWKAWGTWSAILHLKEIVVQSGEETLAFLIHILIFHPSYFFSLSR